MLTFLCFLPKYTATQTPATPAKVTGTATEKPIIESLDKLVPLFDESELADDVDEP